MGATDTYENLHLDAFLGASYATGVFLGTYYVGLFTAAPSDVGGGTEHRHHHRLLGEDRRPVDVAHGQGVVARGGEGGQLDVGNPAGHGAGGEEDADADLAPGLAVEGRPHGGHVGAAVTAFGGAVVEPEQRGQQPVGDHQRQFVVSITL